MASTSFADCEPFSDEFTNSPGPLGFNYDDTPTVLTIKLVVKGIRPKGIMKAENTNVHLKSDNTSLRCCLEIVKMDKKKKPPVKNVLDRRYYEVKKFPGEISTVTFQLSKDACLLTVHKKTPQSWQNIISQNGLD